jgi:hypothetical protein
MARFILRNTVGSPTMVNHWLAGHAHLHIGATEIFPYAPWFSGRR